MLPVGKVEAEIVKDLPATAMVIAVDAVCTGVLLSLTIAVKVDVPFPVGVPEIRPVEELSDNPAGSVPDAIDHVYVGVPPLACSDAE